MADNIQITAGSGTSIASDDIGGVQFQRVKVTWGADGSATDTSAVDPLPVATPVSHVDVTLSLDTSAYTAGDVLADTQVVTNAMRANDSLGILQSVVAIDEDDQGAAFDLHFFSANGSLGTENAAPSTADADARTWLGKVSIGTGDWIDLGGVRVASIANIGLAVKPASGTRNLYVGVINGSGTPTYTASGIKLRLGFQQS